MSGHKSEGAGSLLLNPNALLAIVTIASGLWIVSQKLSSDRPLPPPGAVEAFIGDQKLEARLWEDPLKDAGSESHRVDISLRALAQHVSSRRRPSGGKPARPVLVLPVLLAGGRYSEDQESRVRSRFAVVSALGRAGYAPEDAEHIGSVRVPWLTHQEHKEAAESTTGPSATVTALWEECETHTGTAVTLLGIPVTPESTHVHARFEWYRARTFDQGSGARKSPDVLVLWLDESHFEDDVALRLALFLERLTGPAQAKADPNLTIAVIGPRRSSTLRRLLPPWGKTGSPLSSLPNTRLSELAMPILKQVDLYAATPSSMDEVLVHNPTDADAAPRATVRRLLVEEGPFKSFRNFAATDAQMAREILRELQLRGADMAEDHNHIVLISEWDTFYARMHWLTYLAELARLKSSDPGWTRARFVDAFRECPEGTRDPRFPQNLHSFVYLRGLDGQALGGHSGERNVDESRGPESAGQSLPWEPDINRAEGHAQFDYLGRLGDQIEALGRTLRQKGEGIRAIGIVGSDVYDTLLVLQALRQRFSEVHFFTTDLDVRFLHPRERVWARNLIVASPYGLELHEQFQGTVAPFRDSAQTAQFAATLAALGNPALAALERIPPRRFEVGHRVAVDLSVEDTPPSVTPLHPLTTVEGHAAREDRHRFHSGQILWGLGALGLILLGLSYGWDALRRLTWICLEHLHDGLAYHEADVGDPEDVESMLQELARLPHDPVAAWLTRHPHLSARRHELAARTNELNAHDTARLNDPPREQFALEQRTEERATLERRRERALTELMAAFLGALNEIQPARDGDPEPPLPPAEPCNYGLVAEKIGNLLRSWPRTARVVRHYEVRKSLDDRLARARRFSSSGTPFPLPLPEPPRSAPPTESPHETKGLKREMSQVLDLVLGRIRSRARGTAADKPPRRSHRHRADFAAREAAQGIFRLRCRRLVCFWFSVFLFTAGAVVLTRLIWMDTFVHPEGEPFSLTSGTSAWPAEIVRFLVLALAICFGFALAHRLREAFLTLTRDYRLAPSDTTPATEPDPACAQALWHDYRENSRFRRRWWRIAGITAAYMLLLIAVSQMFNEDVLRPVRGPVLALVDFILLLASIISFLYLAFMTADAARLCRRFIERLSERPTQYPDATHRHFSRQLGRIDEHYIDEWIDLQLIADLTEKVGRLVYFPAALLVLLIVARNSWWDRWPWPIMLIVAFSLNFMVALASVVILQRAAKRAKAEAERSLTAKVKRLQAQASPSAAQNNASQAEKLLEEIRSLDRGAFVPFWENPVVGAIFLSSGGTTVLQAFFLLMNR